MTSATHRPKAPTISRIHSHWSHHPGVRSGDQLTLGERAADATRNGMGSWTFVFCALVFLALWMSLNGDHGFDKYPFILLNLVLSCLAAMQGAILLIAAKRADQISAELANHTFDNTQTARDLLEQHKLLLEENTALTQQVRDLSEQTNTIAAQLEHLTGELHRRIVEEPDEPAGGAPGGAP